MRILLAICFVTLTAAAQSYKISLLGGQGAINPITRDAQRDLTIRIEEKFGAPGKGIPVTFTAPATGPSGFFKHGKRSITVTTDDGGYAVARGFHSNQQAGRYDIRVSASAPGGALQASIAQT